LYNLTGLLAEGFIGGIQRLPDECEHEAIHNRQCSVFVLPQEITQE